MLYSAPINLKWAFFFNSYSKKILLPTYEVMNQKLHEALQALEAEWQSNLGSSGEAEMKKKLAELPAVLLEQALTPDTATTPAEQSAGHSVVLKEKEFLPWIPFSNHHSSKPVEVCCALFSHC